MFQYAAEEREGQRQLDQDHIAGEFREFEQEPPVILAWHCNKHFSAQIYTYIFLKILLLSEDRSRFSSWQSCSRAFAQKESKETHKHLTGPVYLHKRNNFTRFKSSSSVRLINCSQFLMQMNLQIYKCQLTAEMQT